LEQLNRDKIFGLFSDSKQCYTNLRGVQFRVRNRSCFMTNDDDGNGAAAKQL